jgi:hypothetical protein
MKPFCALQARRTAQKHTSGFVPLCECFAFAGVPPILLGRWSIPPGGTPYPLRSRGSEFNQLAPHMPGRLDAPRFPARRQRRGCRSPPTLKSMAQHACQRPAPPQPNRKPVFRSICSANEGT